MTIISLDPGDTFRSFFMFLPRPKIAYGCPHQRKVFWYGCRHRAWPLIIHLTIYSLHILHIIYIYIHIYIYRYLFISCILQCHVVSVCPSYLVSCSAHHQFCIHLLRSVTSSAQVWYLYDARKLFGQEAATQIRLDHC